MADDECGPMAATANDTVWSLRPEPLRIGVSTRALFDLEEEHRVFETQGIQAYAALQLEREDSVLRKGTGFGVVERLLSLNDGGERPFVEVVLLSRNTPDLSLRAFRSIEHYGLSIRTGTFTGGRPVAPYAPAWKADLFLSNASVDVEAAAADVDLPRFRLYRAFERETGMMPHGYQRQARIRLAIRLIRLGEGLAEVAATAGFADQAHFTRAFRSRMGITPGMYRDAVVAAV